MGARMTRIVVGAAVVLGLVAGASTVSAQDKDTLIIALDTLGAQVMDPIADTRAPHAHYHAPIWDSLVGFDLEKGGIGPGVAERWTRADDGKSWTFYLRKGLKFHNGDPVTAHDVKFSLERIMTPESISSGAAALRRAVDKIDVLDDHTVRVTTKGVIPHFAASLSRAVFMEGSVMPKKYIETVGTKGFRDKPIGSGPWKFVRSVPGDRIEYEAVTTPALARHPAVQEDDAAPRARAEHPHRDGPHGRGGDREHRPRSDQGGAGGRHEGRQRAGHDAGHLPVLGPLPSRGEGLAAHRRARARGAVARHRPPADHRPRHGEAGELAAAVHDVPLLDRPRHPALGGLGEEGAALRSRARQAAPGRGRPPQRLQDDVLEHRAARARRSWSRSARRWPASGKRSA